MGQDKEVTKLNVEDLEKRVAPLMVTPSDPAPTDPPSSVSTGSGGGSDKKGPK